jgi:hypothetical protein
MFNNVAIGFFILSLFFFEFMYIDFFLIFLSVLFFFLLEEKEAEGYVARIF